MKKYGRSRRNSKKDTKVKIPKAAGQRLSFYLRELERLHNLETETISSEQIGEILGITSSQVRKDLALFGQFGLPGLGYNVAGLATELRKIIGRDKVWNVMLVGCGNLGNALARHKSFKVSGFNIAAAFDSSESKTGKRLGHLKIQPMNQIPSAIKKKGISIAIIAVPAPSAQKIADNLAKAGIKGILNFAPISLTVPKNVKLVNVDLAVQLEQLIFSMARS